MNFCEGILIISIKGESVYIVNFFRGKRNSYKSDPIGIGMDRGKDDLIFNLTKDGESLRFPLHLSVREIRQQTNLSKLELLEELWYENLLQENDDRYTLSYDNVYELSPEMRGILHIPVETKPIIARLGHTGFIGSNRFQLHLEKHIDGWNSIERTGKTNGPIITLPNKEDILMEKELYEFESIIKAIPPVKDKEKIFQYVAEVRNIAKKLNIPMNSYLEKQEYLFVDGLDVDLSYEDKKEIRIESKYQSSDNIEASLLDQMSQSLSVYAKGDGNEKIFVDPSVRQRTEQINNMEPIRGSDIPKFVENPLAYLPDMDIDLSLFGERVRELGIKVYRAQPYVHAKETDRGWFDLDIGIDATDEEGEIAHSFQMDEVKDLMEKAKENGDEYIEWNDHWIKVPDDTDAFLDANNKLKEELGSNQKLDLSKLPLVLEIFENVDRLEYNQPILELKQEMQDMGVLDKMPPSSFTATLKPFQTDGYVWMKALNFRKIGGLLADDMGLGKTVQVIAFLSYLESLEKITPTIIIVPKTLIENWRNEIQKFAPTLARSIYIHQGQDRMKNPELIKQFSITITTYQTLVRDQLTLAQIDWVAVICDEAQAIKNPTTSSSSTMKALKSRFRLAMTGTPVENGLSELWSIMDFVQPGLLGSLKEFKQNFITPFEKGEQNTSDIEKHLIQRISSVYKRRTKQGELYDQLPKKLVQDIEVSLGKVQKQLYIETIHLVKNKIITGLQAIGQLKKITSHPGIINIKYEDLNPKEVPKLLETLNLLKQIKNNGEKALIFTEYRIMQTILKKHISETLEINPMIINGMTQRRQGVVDLFNNKPGFDVMILSPKAAGTGLTITSANHVIHYTRWWNPAVENQATDRAYRIGQEKDVTVYYPIVKGFDTLDGNLTVEEIIHNIIEEKKELAGSVIVPSSKMNIEEEVLKEFSFH